MQAYFSHSYRDYGINGYFLENFVEEELQLQADQKTDVWAVAKLERYMAETSGLVSIIPRRPTESDPWAYSPYILHELNLARRARVPRLLFVDVNVLNHHQLDFPEDAVTFSPDELDRDKARHREAIKDFSRLLEAWYKPPRQFSPKQVTIVFGGEQHLRTAAEDIAELLRRNHYHFTLHQGRRPDRGLDDIRLLEKLRRAELCVFLLGNRISDAHIALAMAHADCIPSVRLQYDTTANDTNPSVSGVIRWHTTESMLQEFRKQLTSYEKGLVQPVEIARMLNPTEAARLVGTMTWAARDENNWSLDDGPALVKHIAPDQSFVRDEVSRVRETLRRPLGRILDRESTMQLCNLLYDGIKRHRFGYETEQRTSDMSTQRIRSPMQIATHRTGTCIDMACLFASMLESAGQNPLIAVIAGPRFSHALVGYHVRGEPSWEGISKADVQAAFKRRDAVFFEATGAVEADEPIGSEFANERHNKLLTFVDAISAAERIFDRDDVSLKHFVDIRGIRKRTVRT